MSLSEKLSMATFHSSEGAVTAYKEELEGITYQTKASTRGSQHFLPEEELRSYWYTDNRMTHFFKDLGFKLDTGQIVRLKFDALKIISTLIWIGYTEWDIFVGVYCYDQTGLSTLLDCDLPCPNVRESKGAMRLFRKGDQPLNQFIDEFGSCQHVFVPVCFEEGEQVIESMERTIPILEAGNRIDEEGGGGAVTVVRIPKHCLKTKGDHTKYISTILQDDKEPGSSSWLDSRPAHKVACKRIHLREGSQEMGKCELDNLKLLSTRHIIHTNLVQSIATISIDSFKEIVLLFELAVCDLDQFLLGSTETPFGFYTLGDLLEQMYWIGDAVHFLHETLCRHLGAGNQRKAFCHLDIKPGNILMYKLENPKKQIVGTWKLTDFGISEVNELQPMPRNNRIKWTVSARMQFSGRFCSPEVFDEQEAGRGVDIWSLGCVLFLVTMLGTSGFRIELKRMYGEDGKMGMTTKGESFAPNDCFYRRKKGGKPLSGEVNPHVLAWLDTREASASKSCLQKLFRLIKAMLIVDPAKRIDTDGFLSRLLLIMNDLRSIESLQPRPEDNWPKASSSSSQSIWAQRSSAYPLLP